MATITYKTYLMKKTGDSYEKLIDIKDYPDMGSEPERLETTTLSDPMKTYINGLQDTESFTFTANYTASDYQKLKAMEGTQAEYALYLGATGDGASATPTGSEGIFTWTGDVSVFFVGKATDEVREMTISVTPSTPIEFSIGT